MLAKRNATFVLGQDDCGPPLVIWQPFNSAWYTHVPLTKSATKTLLGCVAPCALSVSGRELQEALDVEKNFKRASVLIVSQGPTSSVLHRDPGESLLICLSGTREVWLAREDAFAPDAGCAEEMGGVVSLSESMNPASGAAWVGRDKWHIKLGPGCGVIIPRRWWHSVRAGGRGSVALSLEVNKPAGMSTHLVYEGLGWSRAIFPWNSSVEVMRILCRSGIVVRVGQGYLCSEY